MVLSLAVNRFSDHGDSENDHNGPVKPERNLLAAVLARAICDAFGSAQCERHIVRSARQWLFGNINVSKPFSFGWIAVQLDLDPVALQNSLKQYKNQPEQLENHLGLVAK